MADDQRVLISTFRIPVQIHTRSANAKWLDEIAHTNPLWLHPQDARAFGDVRTGDLLRVSTDIGHFVVKAWVTEGIRPGVVACSHHMGRWKLHRISQEDRASQESGTHPESGQRQLMASVGLDRQGSRWHLRRQAGAGPYKSSDPDTARIWWNDVGVHQNLTFPVHPDPISGMHCWHQAVRVTRAEPEDCYGDVVVDTERSRQVFQEWMERTRSASEHSPDGTRRPHWLLRPLKPSREAFRLPEP
jgi:anaerobic selenocysteine-containing dehydrogenase